MLAMLYQGVYGNMTQIACYYQIALLLNMLRETLTSRDAVGKNRFRENVGLERVFVY